MELPREEDDHEEKTKADTLEEKKRKKKVRFFRCQVDYDFENKEFEFHFQTNHVSTMEPNKILDILYTGKEKIVSWWVLEAKNLDFVLADAQLCILLRYSSLFGPHICDSCTYLQWRQSKNFFHCKGNFYRMYFMCIYIFKFMQSISHSEGNSKGKLRQKWYKWLGRVFATQSVAYLLAHRWG